MFFECVFFKKITFWIDEYLFFVPISISKTISPFFVLSVIQFGSSSDSLSDYTHRFINDIIFIMYHVSCIMDQRKYIVYLTISTQIYCLIHDFNDIYCIIYDFNDIYCNITKYTFFLIIYIYIKILKIKNTVYLLNKQPVSKNK